MKAVLQYRASPGFKQQIVDVAPPWLNVIVVDEFEKESFTAEMQNADVLLHVLKEVTSEVIENSPNLRLIQKIGVGVNTIDLETARKHNVAVCNMPGTNSRAVAELSIALMLASLRRVPYFDREMRKGNGWTTDPKNFDGLGEINGRTVGLVGYGAVAQTMAPTLQAMGAFVLYTATTPKPGAVAEWRDLASLLVQSDIVSLHLPLNTETEKLINAEAISSMKPGAVIINTARGGLIDENVLYEALQTGHISAAGLDVVTKEPADQDNRLFALDNVVVMPHIAWLTPETLARSLKIAFENCRRVRDSEDPLHRVV